MTQTSDRPALRSERALLAGLVVVVVVASLVGSLGAPLIPAIARESGVPLSLAQWTLTAAMLVGAVTTPLLGRLGDGRHRRVVVLSTLSAVTLGCLLAAMTTNIAVLIAGRSLQGTGLGLVPLGLAIARDHLSAERIRPAVSVLSVTAVAGAGFGYPICGAMSRWYGVRASFGFGAAIAAVALGVAVVVLPRGAQVTRRRLDLLGAVLLGSALTALLLAVTRGPALGWSSPVVLGLAGAAVVVGGLTVWHLLRVSDPLVDLRLLGHRPVLLADVTGLAAGTGVYVLLSEVMWLLQTPRDSPGGLGATVFVASCAIVPFSALSLTTSRIAVRVVRASADIWLLPVGCLVFALALASLLITRHQLWAVFLTMGLAGVGAGLTFAAMPGLIVAAVPAGEVGSATGFNQVLRSVGFATGSTAAATILATYTADRYPDPKAYDVSCAAGAVLFAVTAVVVAVLARRGALPRATRSVPLDILEP
jgi:MFS family permease